MNFVWTVAWRLLREGRFQTALILAGVSIGVGVIVYITAIDSPCTSAASNQTLTGHTHQLRDHFAGLFGRGRLDHREIETVAGKARQ